MKKLLILCLMLSILLCAAVPCLAAGEETTTASALDPLFTRVETTTAQSAIETTSNTTSAGGWSPVETTAERTTSVWQTAESTATESSDVWRPAETTTSEITSTDLPTETTTGETTSTELPIETTTETSSLVLPIETTEATTASSTSDTSQTENGETSSAPAETSSSDATSESAPSGIVLGQTEWLIIAVCAAVLVIVITVCLIVVIRRGKNKVKVIPYRKISVRCESGALAGKTFDCLDSFQIGRDKTRCEIVLPMDAGAVDAVHCRVTAAKDGVFLEDLGSAHGTYLDDGMRLEAGKRHLLLNGSRFGVGDKSNSFVIYF